MASISSLAVADGVIQIGAQFADGNETSKPANVVKASGSTTNLKRLKAAYPSTNVLKKYSQTAQRTEVLFIGKQSSRTSRAFHRHLLITINGTLMQIEASDIEECLSLNK